MSALSKKRPPILSHFFVFIIILKLTKSNYFGKNKAILHVITGNRGLSKKITTPYGAVNAKPHTRLFQHHRYFARLINDVINFSP